MASQPSSKPASDEPDKAPAEPQPTRVPGEADVPDTNTDPWVEGP